MTRELKTFEWTCDCCKRTQTVMSTAKYTSRPEGWITTSTCCGDFECRGGHENDYCPSCVTVAKEKHKKAEDNHYGKILRNIPET